MIDKKLTSEQIRQCGLEALKRELGAVGMVRFLQQLDRGRGNYAKDRHEWQDQMNVEDVVAQIRARRKEKAALPPALPSK